VCAEIAANTSCYCLLVAVCFGCIVLAVQLAVHYTCFLQHNRIQQIRERSKQMEDTYLSKVMILVHQ
jgi:hypothetical protein